MAPLEVAHNQADASSQRLGLRSSMLLCPSPTSHTLPAHPRTTIRLLFPCRRMPPPCPLPQTFLRPLLQPAQRSPSKPLWRLDSASAGWLTSMRQHSLFGGRRKHTLWDLHQPSTIRYVIDCVSYNHIKQIQNLKEHRVWK